MRNPIKRKRNKPRRGRIVNGDFLQWMFDTQPCLVDQMAPLVIMRDLKNRSCRGRLTTHHVREFGSCKNDERTLRLCEGHHLHDFGPTAIEHGKKQFEELYGINIEAAIEHYQGLYREQTGKQIA